MTRLIFNTHKKIFKWSIDKNESKLFKNILISQESVWSTRLNEDELKRLFELLVGNVVVFVE